MSRPPQLRSIVLLVQCASLLATSFPLLAQTPAVTPSQGQRPAFLPHIKEVKSPAGTESGSPKLLPLQTFSIEGTLFSDLASKNRVLVIYPATSWTPEYTAAAIVPLSATTTTLTARIPASVETGRYKLRVKVDGSEQSNGVFVEVADLNIGARMGSPRITSVSPDSGMRGESITLEGLFRSSPRVFLDPASAGGAPISITPSSAMRERIKFKVPLDVSLGGYRVSVASPGQETRTNALRLRVVDNKTARYAVEIGQIRCITESADGMGSDEIYVVALSFEFGSPNSSLERRFGVHSPEEAGSSVFNFVDAGETVQLPRPLTVRVFEGPSAPDHLILIGLEEYDGSEGADEIRRGEDVLKGKGGMISKESHVPALSSREKAAVFARFRMMGAITAGSSDELLGVEELKLTAADVQKAAQLDGAPLTKQLVFRGDGSHYVMDVHFRLVK